MAYVYKHIRKDNNKPFYIGISLKDDKYYRRAYTQRQRTKYWKNIVKKHDYVVCIIEDHISAEEAIAKEIELIKFYGRADNGGILCNLTDGGQGCLGRNYRPSEKTKKLLSEKNKKIIIDINTGVYYIGTKEVCQLYGYNRKTFMDYLNGRLPNFTPFRYANEDGIKQVNDKVSKPKRDRGNNGASRLVLDLQTGIYYDCVKDACDAKQQSENKAYQQLRGKNKNTLYLRYA
jgi:hypothetical protein